MFHFHQLPDQQQGPENPMDPHGAKVASCGTKGQKDSHGLSHKKIKKARLKGVFDCFCRSWVDSLAGRVLNLPNNLPSLNAAPLY